MTLVPPTFPISAGSVEGQFPFKAGEKSATETVVVVSRGVVQPSECEVLSGHPLELHSDTLTGSDQQEAGG